MKIYFVLIGNVFIHGLGKLIRHYVKFLPEIMEWKLIIQDLVCAFGNGLFTNRIRVITCVPRQRSDARV